MLNDLIKRVFPDPLIGTVEYYLKPGLKESWGGAMNGQAFRRRIFDDLASALPLRAIVETGTYRGTTTTLFVETGVPVYSVEANPRFHAYTKARFRGRSGVQLHLGDSRSFLRKLSEDPAVPKSDVLFYLDAHWEEDLPLREEVDLVFSKWERAVVLVDDFEVPGTDYAYDDYGPGKALTLDYLQPLSRWNLTAYFPAAGPDEETGAKRGCVVLCADPEVAASLDALETLVRHEEMSAPGALNA